MTYIIAHLCGLKPRYFIHTIGDTHIYVNHIEQVKKQLKRTPKQWATISFKNPEKIKSLDDINEDIFIIKGYDSWPYIKGKMAV